MYDSITGYETQQLDSKKKMLLLLLLLMMIMPFKELRKHWFSERP